MKKTYRIWIYLDILSFLISSLSVMLLLIPTENKSDEQLPLTFSACGILFWLGLILGCVIWFILYRAIRKKEIYQAEYRLSRPGIITFLKNKYAYVIDCMLGVSLLGGIVGVVLLPYNQIYNCIFIALFLFCFYMHCLFNGKVYNYILF